MARAWTLKSRPAAMPEDGNFALVDVPAAPLGAGQVRVANRWLSVDPYMRGRMNDVKSYVPPFALGEPMQGGAIGEVVESNSPDLPVGAKVQHMLGWREEAVLDAAEAQQLPALGVEDQAYLGQLGMPGMTAYFGLLDVASAKPGDVVFVSAASGGVGSLVCQMAKLKGHQVIGAAGGEAKAAFLRDRLRLDGVIDYKAEPNLTKALAREAKALGTEGVDLYFDNVGGDHLHAAIAVAKPFARMAICGMISQYNSAGQVTPPRNLTLIMGKRLRLEGFIALDHFDLEPHFLADVKAWHQAGLLEPVETVFDGIDHALDAFNALFDGSSMGRTLVRLESGRE